MKILIVGNGAKHSKVRAYERCFEKKGEDVSFLDKRGLYTPSFVNRLCNIFYQMPRFWNADRLNQAVLGKVQSFNPDLVFLFKPIFIRPGTVREIKKGGALVFSYHSDNAFVPRNSSVSFERSFDLYDAHFFQNPHNVEFAKKKGYNAYYLPSAVDTSIHYPVEVSEEEKKEIGADIVFVGTYVKGERRERWMEKLCKDGFDVKVYGNRWNRCWWGCRCLRNKEAIAFEARYGEEFSKIINASKITINFLREHNRDVLNSRSFEIPACKGFMLHENADEAMEWFEDGEEAVFFSSYDDLLEKIRYYLKNKRGREKIARAGYERVRDKNHSFESRTQKVLGVYKKLT